ncbi:MAG: archaetidylserine decarboxylase, partial [Thermoplasmata archaeon]
SSLKEYTHDAMRKWILKFKEFSVSSIPSYLKKVINFPLRIITYLSNLKRIYLNILPSWLLTRAAGYLANIEFRKLFFRFILALFIYLYSKIYNVNLDESAKPIEGFPSFNAFFTRELKKDARIVCGNSTDLVSPVDARITFAGTISEGMLIQAKGIMYSLDELLDDKALAEQFYGGSYITLYLSPGDYHRIHSPVDGIIRRCIYIPGELFPVNNLSTTTIRGLFPRNHRVITIIESHEFGRVAVVKIAATVVGTISLKYLDGASLGGWKKAEPPLPVRSILRGEHLATFELGSTVILLFQKEKCVLKKGLEGCRVKMGEIIGKATLSESLPQPL